MILVTLHYAKMLMPEAICFEILARKKWSHCITSAGLWVEFTKALHGQTHPAWTSLRMVTRLMRVVTPLCI